MQRPDQKRFDMFARHFDSIDDELAVFCEHQQFRLEKNLLRQPGRVLRRPGNPEFLIDISLSGYWLEMDFDEDMPHTITALAYYQPEDREWIWKGLQEIAHQMPFSKLRHGLGKYLSRASDTISTWTPDELIRVGTRIENLKRKYRVP